MEQADRPNIVFVFSDQQRWDTCGCYGQPLDTTPNLDRLAREGVLFEHAFTCQPVCGPARSCLQTGKYATENHCPTNHCMLGLNEITVPKLLRASGYEVGYIGKWHLASYGPRSGANDFRIRAVPDERRGGYDDYWLASDTLEFTSHSYDGHMFDSDGFKREFPEGRYRVDAQTDWVLEYLETRAMDKPFFLFTSYIEPHHQNDHNCYEGPHRSKEKYADFPVPGDLVDTTGDWRENYPDYLGCINSLDHNLGRIRDKLQELGIADNTLIVYTSDHGSHFRTRNAEYKRSCHDGCVRIPLVICGPGFRGGQTVDLMTSLIDLPPTVLSSGEVTVPGFMQGRPLQEATADPAPDWPDDVYIQISESQCARAIRTSKWKYSVRAPDKGGGDPSSDVYVEDFLYDLDKDPHEQHNLVSDPSLVEIRQELAQTLKRRMVEAGEEEPRLLSRAEENSEQLD